MFGPRYNHPILTPAKQATSNTLRTFIIKLSCLTTLVLEITLRHAKASDNSALRTILYNTIEGTWVPHLTAEAAQAYRHVDRPAAYVASRGSEFSVAKHDGQIVGFVDRDGNFVNALHVHSRWARMGVGNRLMDKVEAEIGSEGFSVSRLEIDTFNLASQTFDLARGYYKADRYPDTELKSGFATLLLVKPRR